jgi:glucose-1-phosphate thymidylyltransferase
MLILGDNIFHGVGLGETLETSIPQTGCHIFTYQVGNPENYGVLYSNSDGPLRIVEKPTDGNSNLAITGLYFFDSDGPGYARQVKPGRRGELEITDLIDLYLQQGELGVTHLSRGVAWLDTGTPDGMNDAANFVRVLEDRTGQKIACLEEIALHKNWISKDFLIEILDDKKSAYADYLRQLAHHE